MWKMHQFTLDKHTLAVHAVLNYPLFEPTYHLMVLVVVDHVNPLSFEFSLLLCLSLPI